MKLIATPQYEGLRFPPDETNAARRMVLRLMSEFGLKSQKLAERTTRLQSHTQSLDLCVLDDGGLELRAVDPNSRMLLKCIHTGLSCQWRDPASGPTGKRRLPASVLKASKPQQG
jgi:hypothetical protein